MTEQVFQSEAVALNVAEGPETGAPLVLLHGVTRRWQDFAPVIPALSWRWQVLALDFRGHGRSGRTPGAYRVVDYVPDIVAFVRDRLGEPAVLFGHSLGAMVAVAVAAELPERVRALVLEDPPFETMGRRIRETAYHSLFEGYRRLADPARATDELATVLADLRVATPGGSEAKRLGALRDPAALRFHASCLKRLDPAALDPILQGRWLDGYALNRLLDRVACPALLLQGDPANGGALTHDDADRIIIRLSQIILMRFAGVGHQIHADATSALIHAVLGFLESLD